MKKTILKPLVMGVLASAVMTGCGGGSSKSVTPDSGEKASCDYNIQGGNSVAIALGTAYTNPAVRVKKEGEDVAFKVDGVVDTNKLGSYDITYSSESCKNTQVRTVTVVSASCDYSLSGDNPMDIYVGDTFSEPGFVVKNGDKVIKGTSTGEVDTSAAGSYKLTYAGEGCRNTHIRTVKVKEKEIAIGKCSYELNGDNPLEMTVDTGYVEQGVTIKNSKGEVVTGTAVGTVDKSVIGTNEITYQSNSCSNTKTRTVKVVAAECNYKLLGSDPLLVSKDRTLVDPGVVVKNSGKTVKSTVASNVDTSILGDYTLTYQGDNCGNTLTRAVKVKLQTCDYTLLGDSPLEVVVNKPYTDPGAELKDEKGVVLEAKAMGTGDVDNTKVGEYVVSYKNEACANKVDRIVKVRALTKDELKDVILPKF